MLETPGRTHYLIKYVCPICEKRRFWADKKQQTQRGDLFWFTGSWGCEGGCIGITITLDMRPQLRARFEVNRWREKLKKYGTQAIPKA